MKKMMMWVLFAGFVFSLVACNDDNGEISESQDEDVTVILDEALASNAFDASVTYDDLARSSGNMLGTPVF